MEAAWDNDLHCIILVERDPTATSIPHPPIEQDHIEILAELTNILKEEDNNEPITKITVELEQPNLWGNEMMTTADAFPNESSGILVLLKAQE